MSISAGTKLGRYEIRSKIGEGGMGEVYLAQDTKLDRKVALKILPEEVAADRNRMNRFVQEAKAASALNHPNIITIYEIDQTDSVSFIAIEFIDGETLRERMRNAMKPGEVLDLAIQVASALAAAHAARIIHRDIKPENIMVRHDGIVKVLDFGLAKLTERLPPDSVDAEAATKALVQTEPGVVMGTVAYMSPEQARGLAVDARTDIFSLGVVIYEMVAGRAPFGGATRSDLMVALLERDPPPLARFTPEAPAELERIVRKALAKDREERYQTAKDLLIDLKGLKQKLVVDAEIKRSAAPELSAEGGEAKATDGRVVSTAPGAAAQTAVDGSGAASSAEYIVKEIKRHKKSAAVTLAALVIAVATLAYLSYFKHKRAPALTEQDTILIADFVNKTGDALFDDTLKQALALQLEQSPFLNIFADERVRETLRYMSRSPDERVTRDVAKEICQRQGLKAMLAGSIAPLGSHYVLALEAINAQTGDVLARAQTQAESKEQVLEALGRAATDLRQKLGESLRSIQKFDAPIEQATTSSLEALQAFALAENQSWDITPKAIPLYERAIEHDPNFALAYSKLSVAYTKAGQLEMAAKAAQRAFELRDRVSERERLEISSRYYANVTGEWDKVIETAELWNRTYPNKSPLPYNILAFSYSTLGQFEKAVEAAKQAIRLSPNFAAAKTSLGRALIGLNRFAEAKEVGEQAIAQKIDYAFIRRGLYEIAFIRGDAAAMQQQVDGLRGKSNEYDGFDWQAATAAFAGQWQRAQELSGRAVELAAQSNAKEVAAQYASGEALRNGVFGKCEQSKAAATRALALARGRVSLARSGLALALCGEAGQVQRLVDELKERYPKDSLINGHWLPVIQAASEIKGKNPALAIQALETASRYEAAAEFHPQYLRGQAYLKLGRGAEAAAEFQKIVDHRGQAPLSALYSLAQLGLARAIALQGDSEKARKSYQDFFALWKDADADLPILIEAKKEYEKLK